MAFLWMQMALIVSAYQSEIQSEGFKTLRNNMEVSFMVEEIKRDKHCKVCCSNLRRNIGRRINDWKGADKNASVPG